MISWLSSFLVSFDVQLFFHSYRTPPAFAEAAYMTFPFPLSDGLIFGFHSFRTFFSCRGFPPPPAHAFDRPTEMRFEDGSVQKLSRPWPFAFLC